LKYSRLYFDIKRYSVLYLMDKLNYIGWTWATLIFG